MSLDIDDKKANNCSSSPKTSKGMDLEQIRQTMAKRSLDVKFDLHDSDYKPVENIGIGAYGVVCSAIHTKSGDRVAIKKIPCVFDALTIAKRTYREIKILKHFKHDNIICIREILKPKETVKDFKDIYVVFDLMESDLHRIIYSKQELSEEHVRYFLYQILRGLKYIHSAHVIHRDLKPSNLLVNEDCHLRIGDFGMARGISYTPNEPSYYMTQYVATRWYRAPEILLSMLEYGTAVDMWSVGCIFAEMLGRKHLFPGKDYLTQVKLILGVLGTPSEKIMNNCQNDILKRIIKSFGKKSAVEWSKLFPKASKKSIDLLGKMLVLDPADRITPERALSHRLLNNYHDPDDEPICVPAFNFDFEKEDMDKKKLRSAIMEEVMSFHEPKPTPPALSFSAFLRPAPKDESLSAPVAERHESLPTDVKQNASSSNSLVHPAQASLPTPSSKHVALPASLDPNLLGAATPADVDMLSAQSTMDVQDFIENVGETATKETKSFEENLQQQSGESPNTSSTGKVSDKKPAVIGSTISEDTKALVKQALMNANQRRQRAESQTDDKESKPVTAMQRQKEREEKRRKKKERALEKIKKNKSKKGTLQDPAHLLSSADVELLRRWTSMQNPVGPGLSSQDSGSNSNSNSSPPHPGSSISPPQCVLPSLDRSNSCSSLGTSSGLGFVGPGRPAQQVLPAPRQVLAKASSSGALPVTLGTPLRFSSTETASGATVLIPSSQLGALGQANFIPVLAKVEIKRILPQQQKRQLKPLNSAASTSQNPATLPVSSSQQASESTRTLLQNVLRERNQANSQQPQTLSSCQSEQMRVTSSSSTVSGFSNDVASNTNRQQNISNPPEIPHDSRPLSTVDSSFNSQGQNTMPPSNSTSYTAMSNPGSDKEVVRALPAQEDIISPLGSAGTSDLMEFLDQIKDSSIRLKLASAGSTASLKSPPLSSFSQNSALPSDHPAMHNPIAPSLEGLTYNTTQETNSLSTDNPAALQSCNVAVREHNEFQRPFRSSLPFSSYSSEGVTTHPVRPSRSSEPCPAYALQNQSMDNLPLQAFGGGSMHTAQSQTSFPTSNYADSFIDATHDQRSTTSSYLQEFSSQHSSGLGLNQSSHQSPEVLFPSSTFSSEPNVYSQQQNATLQKQQQLPYAQQHNQMLYTYTAETSNTTNVNFPQQPQTFTGNFSNFDTPQQQQQQEFQIPHQTFSQASTNLSSVPLNPQVYGLPQQQANSMSPQGVASGSRSPRLTVDCSKTAGNTSPNLNTTPAVSSSTTNTNSMPRTAQVSNQRQADLIALLSKQLSRAEVADIFPPALALTPRGTGAGYGVGMDLDSLLTDAQDGASHRGEHSPLSSSLLADWLDLSSNISHADLEALEREMALQSPMHVSYGDLGL